jgi:phospholipid/cholesterol/gamma-HCH transport system permease protein
MPVATQVSGDTLTLRLEGDCSIDRVGEIERELGALPLQSIRQITVVSNQLKRLDLSAAWLIRNFLNAASEQGAAIDYQGTKPANLDFVEDMTHEDSIVAHDHIEPSVPISVAIEALGKNFLGHVRRARASLEFFGRVLASVGVALSHPKRLRPASIARHVYETGVQAIPIVALIAFLITLVIAYIGAQQLERFGAEIYTVNLVTVGVLREMGVLLTAIIVAGRSGSAFAAEIGVMQLNDEVDALKSIGMDPYEVLVVPRVLGLIIALPLLTILADAMGLAGGAILCSWLLDISWPQFIARVQEALSPTTFWAGFLKAPVFAVLIALTGAYRGMQVRDSSRELGRLTTVAVVQSIFLVIFANAIFAILYLELDF